MQLYEPLREREAEARTLALRRTCLRLLELLEDPALVLERDARTGVGDMLPAPPR